MNYTDLHCDTALVLYEQKKELCKNDLHIDLQKANVFNKYTQIYAIWSDNDIDDESAYMQFFSAREYFLRELEKNNIPLNKLPSNNKYNAILAVEGAKLLSDDLSRVDKLYESGVRILTLVWKGICKTGGAYDTDTGLTDFGKAVVKKCNELGILVDVSHISERGFYDVLDCTDKPFIASHSNSKTIFQHDRNLTDAQFTKLIQAGGVAGISLAKTHLAENADVHSVINHIEHYLSLGGENHICLGCDFDGAELPDGISNLSDLTKIESELRRLKYTNDVIEKIFYKNADRFLMLNI